MPSTNDNSLTLPRALWALRYRARDEHGSVEPDLAASRRRVARVLAAVETQDVEQWRRHFEAALHSGHFLPGGRILAGAGTGYRRTLFSCFVMAPPEDSLAGIFAALRESALTLQQGGGIGMDFSTLRPRGSPCRRTGNTATGPVSFLRLWDAMCATVMTDGRGGAMMGTLRCDHPDILEFIDAKAEPGNLSRFNLSVQISDDFMKALDHDEPWPLVFPARPGESPIKDGEWLRRRWSDGVTRPCRVHGRIPARQLWDRLVKQAHAGGDPGILFVDTLNAHNNLYYCEHITATNPCGEVPLPPHGACNLGSLNLPLFVRAPFTGDARIDHQRLEEVTGVAVRMLDNAVDASLFPLSAQAREARATRRLGLGVTGLADALIMLGLDYRQERARETAAGIIRTIRNQALRTSAALAREKGSFPRLRSTAWLSSKLAARLPKDLVDTIARDGLRNSHLLALAPAGSISLLAGNVSSGIEPVHSFHHQRHVRLEDGATRILALEDYAWSQWCRQGGSITEVPSFFVHAREISPEEHLAMQATLQAEVDGGVSKTVNLAADAGSDTVAALFLQAHARGLKGITVFRACRRHEGVLIGGRHCVNTDAAQPLRQAEQSGPD